MNKRFALLLMILFICSYSLLPQGGMIGAIKGTIKDSKTQGILADVKIRITDTQSRAKHEIRTDKNGYFYRSGFYPGNYEIAFEKEGYVPAATTLHLSPGETRDASLMLEPIQQAVKGSASFFNRGLQQVSEEKYADAVNTFSQAMAEDSGNFLFYYYRGFCQEMLKNTDQAIADFAKAVELKPDFMLGLASLAKLYAKKKDFQKAADWYKKTYDLGITDVTAIYNYGVSLINLTKNEEAKAVFEKLLTLDPANADACYELGLIYLGLGNSATAKELLEKFLQLDSQNKNAATAQEILKTLK